MSVARAIADLRWVAAYWPDLYASRLQGTPTPWRRPQLTAEQRAERDHQAWLERLDRTGDAFGVSPAPLRVPVLDVLTDLLTDAVDLADELAAALMCPALEPPSTGLADARPYLEFAARRLAEVDEPELGAWAYERSHGLVATVARALGLLYDGQVLDVVCPWCRGVTPETPAGGARTWRVRDLFGGRGCEHGEPYRRLCTKCEQQIAITCENDGCEPPSKHVGTWWRGQPCWPLHEWEWLSEQVRRAEIAQLDDQGYPQAS
ncbi:hypothetical protein [Nonomuraea sp. NPDC050786]|uniref:hypothetical protein n=1 Tax=Nonomuraea sp. NPDC050786 TaxID=3154840 RepID=UPI0034052BF7